MSRNPLMESSMVVAGDSSRLKTTTLWEWLFMGIESIVLPVFLFTTFILKLLPLSNYPLIPPIQNDRYYCYLVPLTLAVLVVALYFHWLSMKLFKHA
ncbi:hypothetical protein REPUB_Repub11eG0099500 [Reevesia pubescens]